MINACVQGTILFLKDFINVTPHDSNVCLRRVCVSHVTQTSLSVTEVKVNLSSYTLTLKPNSL